MNTLTALNHEAWRLQATQPEKARTLARTAESLACELHDTAERAKALRTLGACDLTLGNHEAARAALHEALALLETDAHEPHTRMWAHRLLFRSAFQTQAYEQALRHAHAALELIRVLQDPQEEAKSLNDVGLIYAHLGAYQQGLTFLLESLRLSEQVGTSRLGSPLNNLGNIYLMQDEPATAAHFFQRAHDAFRAEGARREEAIALGNLGRAAEARGELTQARTYHEASLQVLRELNEVTYLAPALSKLGSVLGKQKSYERAQACFEEALALHEQYAGFRYETLAGLAELHLSMNSPQQAIALYQEMFAVAETSGDARLRADAHLGLSRAFEATGELPEALAHHRQYHIRTRELDRALCSNQTKALLLKHEVDQVRQEQALLRHQHQALGEAHAQLQVLHTQLEAQAAQLERLSLEDALTGLFNRRSLTQCLSAEALRAQRYGSAFSLMIGDIDAFKRINDELLHAVGDEVLKAVASILRQHTREVDVVVRFGGEEFVVLFPETTLGDAVTAAEKLRREIEQYPWDALHAGLQVTMSMGVAEAVADTGGEALLKEADLHLYRAKNAGKNTVCYHDSCIGS